MKLHLYALVPFMMALFLLAFGRIFSDWPMTFIGIFFLLWGISIHAKHLAVYRKMLRREGFL